MPLFARDQSYLLRLTIMVVAFFLIAMGGITMLAWMAPQWGFQTLFDGFLYLMKYDTALCFVFSGIGLLAALHHLQRPAIIAASMVFAIGAITVAEYLGGMNFGFDQLLVGDFMAPLSHAPGRMATGSAMAFACAGLQLLVSSVGYSRRAVHSAIIELLGSVVFILGAQEMLAHLLDRADLYSWGDYLHMAPQTSFSFVLLGAGLLALAWHQQNMHIARVPLWLPGILCFLVLYFDIERPRGISGGIVYIPLVFCSLWFSRPHTAFVFAAIATLMSVIAFFLKPADFVEWIVIFNRFLMVGVIWFVATLIYLRRIGELALQQSERRLSAVVDHAVDGLISINKQGIVEHFNPACEIIFGYQADEVIGKNIKMLMPEPYHGEHDTYLSRYLMTGKNTIIGTPGREVTAKRKNGAIFPMDLSISSFQLEDGQHFSGIIRDITARKQAEQKNSLLAAIIASSDDAIISKAFDDTITSWNAGAERLFGYTVHEAVGQSINLIIPPERAEEEAYIMGQLHGDSSIEHFETVRRKKDGRNFHVSVTMSPIRNVAGQVIGSSKILRDITLQKTVEAEKLQYTKALELSNKELDDFAYIASHDLKEPLRGLFNNAQFLLDDYKAILDQDGIRRLQRLGYLTQRMERLINDLLYFSRLGRHDLAIQSTNLNDVIHDISAMMEVTLKEENAVVRMPQVLPTITCDTTRITEVFRNLVTNAIKYNDKPEKIVEVGYFEKERVFYVRDNGIGIAKQFHEEIFRIFKRLNNEDDSKKGTGVGLTFVRKIITRYGGTIWLESEPGAGTTFYFTLATAAQSQPTAFEGGG